MSAEPVRIIRVFVSSPSDVAQEKKVLEEVIQQINKSDGQGRNVRIELWDWSQAAPRIGPPVQDVIDAQTLPYDVYLGIMSGRFGTPTGGYGSGTEKEFREALEKWGRTGVPWILFYFNDVTPQMSSATDAEQYVLVRKFRDELQSRGLTGAYKGVRDSAESFREKVDPHLRNLIDRLSAPPAPASAPAARRSKPAVPREYLEWLRRDCSGIELLGLRTRESIAVTLNQVYVPLTTSFRPEQARSLLPNLPSGPERQEGKKPAPQLLLDALNSQSLYVSGNPGSGKSTFCRWAAWLVANGEMPPWRIEAEEGYRETFPANLRGRLPILIRLREFVRHLPRTPGRRTVTQKELEDAIAQSVDALGAAGLHSRLFRDHLSAGSALLMLDGVDEVPVATADESDPSSPRAMLIAGLDAAVPQWTAAGNRILLTSRPYGLDPGDAARIHLPQAPLESLARPLQNLLVQRWFDILSREDPAASALAGDMLASVRGRAELRLEELAANPMLLGAMCIIYSDGKRLPQDKFDLYTRIVDNVLYNRYPRDSAAAERARGRLSFIAHSMHSGEALREDWTTPRAEITYDEVDRILLAYRQQSSWTEEGFAHSTGARTDLLSNSGLLLSTGDRSAGFYHLSFQEFLCSERIWDLDENALCDRVRQRAAVPEWRNTLGFVFGALLVKHSSPDRAVRLLGRVMDTAGPESPRLLVIAADWLEMLVGRAVRVAGPEEKFKNDCVLVLDVAESGLSAQERRTLGLMLGRIGDPRIAPDLREHTNARAYVRIPAGSYIVGEENRKFQIDSPLIVSRYPVTNSQFRTFMEDGGYSRREFWTDEGWSWLEREHVTEPLWWQDTRWTAPNQPAVGVSFWEARAFCRWAGGRLPAEWEWEAAARGPHGHEYPWGGKWADGICNTSEAGLGVTSPVGIFRGSRQVDFQIDDLAGNVWEWCDSLWKTGSESRVVRGGSWFYSSRLARAACRYNGQPVSRFNYVGFRVVCDAPRTP